MSGTKLPPKTPNPYAVAASTYQAQRQKAPQPHGRHIEAEALLKAARQLQEIQDKWPEEGVPQIDDTLQEALKNNREIWSMFYNTSLTNSIKDQPEALRSNIINMANFIFKQSLEIISAPSRSKLGMLISINRDIASALLTKPHDEASS
ncbi:MAG: flagellar FlaF family protein [Alphaproteobacteria bacterium]|nr:flagellar FlaF family protein [Alphaproteobacteria bacterium]